MLEMIKLKCDNCGWQYAVGYDKEEPDEELWEEIKSCPCGGTMEEVDEWK